jgi:hypothetical protein
VGVVIVETIQQFTAVHLVFARRRRNALDLAGCFASIVSLLPSLFHDHQCAPHTLWQGDLDHGSRLSRSNQIVCGDLSDASFWLYRSRDRLGLLPVLAVCQGVLDASARFACDQYFDWFLLGHNPLDVEEFHSDAVEDDTRLSSTRHEPCAFAHLNQHYVAYRNGRHASVRRGCPAGAHGTPHNVPYLDRVVNGMIMILYSFIAGVGRTIRPFGEKRAFYMLVVPVSFGWLITRCKNIHITR